MVKLGFNIQVKDEAPSEHFPAPPGEELTAEQHHKMMLDALNRTNL